MGDKTLSKELIARLPRYFRYLDDYMNVGIKRSPRASCPIK